VSVADRRVLQVVAALVAGSLLLVAALIALAPTEHGDNYCGRLYFDTNRTAVCRHTMAVRGIWFLGFAAVAAAILIVVLVSVGRPRLFITVLLGALALTGVLVGFNRLLQPIDTRTAYCGSVLNPIVIPDVAGHDFRCDALFVPFKRTATGAFVVSALAGLLAAGSSVWPKWRRGPRDEPSGDPGVGSG